MAVIVLAILSAALVPSEVFDRILHGPPKLRPAKPDVLVVSSRPSDQVGVTQTVAPRGYRVRLAADADAALANLQLEPGRIGIVVIDGDMVGAGRIVSEVKAACPDARLIVLSGPREVASVASRLVDAGVI